MINGVKRNCIQERYCGISNQHINQERKKWISATMIIRMFHHMTSELKKKKKKKTISYPKAMLWMN